MMDHMDLPKGKFPDTDKDEVIHDRYTLRGPPGGKILGSFNSFQLGLLWKIPNIDETDVLKSLSTDYFIEEKVFFEQNFEKDENVALPMKIDLYKTFDSPDLHLRAVYGLEDSDELEKDEKGVLSFLKSKNQILGACIVNDVGKSLLEEKLARSYVFVGRRFWEISSLISAKDFNNADLLTSDGSLLIRITFGCKQELTPEHFYTKEVLMRQNQTSACGTPTATRSKSNANLLAVDDSDKCENDKICEDSLSQIDISTISLESLPFRLKTFSQLGKFTDGILHVYDKSTGGSVDFPIHRVVLAGRSPFFEVAFENSPRVTVDQTNAYCMENVLDYMYTGEVKSRDFNLLSQLITVSEELEIIGLKNRCINSLVDCQMEIPQAMATFKLGKKYNSVVLRVYAAEFLNKLKGQIGAHTEDFKEFMNETGTRVLFDWLIREPYSKSKASPSPST